MEKSTYITVADPLTQKLLKQLGMPEHCVTATIKFQPRELVKVVWECIATRAQIETLTGANLEYVAESEVVPAACFRDRK
jgi:hypothetical protein